MKKILFFFIAMLFVTSCTATQDTTNTGSETQHTATLSGTSTETSKQGTLKAFVEKLAPHLGKTAKDVIEEPTLYSEYEYYGSLPSYAVKAEALSSRDFIDIDPYTMFDGWKEVRNRDPLLGFYNEYVNEEFVCAMWATASDEKMVEAFLNLETDEQSEEFYNTLRYDVVLHCAEKPAGSLDRTALNFVASGDKPLWRGTFNAEVLRIDADAIANGSSMIGIDSWMQQGEDYLIKTSNPQNELSAEIRKKTCVDTAGKEFAYTVRVELDEAVFTGCAESLDIAFQENTLGKLATFLKKHQIAYTGKIPPEKANYSLITKGSLVEVIIWSTENMWESQERTDELDGDGLSEFIVLNVENGKPKILWTWGEIVSPEVCEATKDIAGIESFGIFFHCPKG